MDFDAEWRAALAVPITQKGDQPSEILPGLFLSGHPSRFRVKGGISHPSRCLLERHAVGLIVNCCAPPSSAPYVVEDIATGEKLAVAPDVALRALATPHEGLPTTVVHMNIAAEDEVDYDLAQSFPSAVACITHAVGGGRGVLVHCQMGVSRSATILGAFLMARYRLGHAEAVAHMESRRSCVNPNPGFREQLRVWETVQI